MAPHPPSVKPAGPAAPGPSAAARSTGPCALPAVARRPAETVGRPQCANAARSRVRHAAARAAAQADDGTVDLGDVGADGDDGAAAAAAPAAAGGADAEAALAGGGDGGAGGGAGGGGGQGPRRKFKAGEHILAQWRPDDWREGGAARARGSNGS